MEEAIKAVVRQEQALIDERCAKQLASGAYPGEVQLYRDSCLLELAVWVHALKEKTSLPGYTNAEVSVEGEGG